MRPHFALVPAGTFLLTVAGFAIAELAQNDISVSHRRFAVDTGELLRQIEAEHPDDIQRDTAGDIIFVRLRQGWASDANLTALEHLNSLRGLALEPVRAAQPTAGGIRSLDRLSNLESLRMACSGWLPAGIFAEICKLNQLRSLSLCAACPPVAEYNSVTNLQGLTELHVTYCTNFGDAQMALLTTLPNLRSLELKADALSDYATNLLSAMKALTNALVEPTRRKGALGH